MIRRLFNFVKYNNSFTLLVLFVFISTGTVFAANEDVRESVVKTIVSSEDKVLSVDNRRIVTVDLDSYVPTVQVLSIEEDDEFYYVTYELGTISISDSAWQDVKIEEVLKVSKELLGERDLGLYVAEELDELVANRLAFLREVQEGELTKGSSQKVVERTYAGLVGRFLDSKEETFAGYEPVVKEEPVKLAVVEKEEKDLNEKVIEVPDESDTDKTETSDDTNNTDPGTSDTDTGTSSNSTTTESSDDVDTDSGETSTSTSTATSTEDISENDSGDTSTSTPDVTDTIPPVIELVGDGVVELEFGESYVEAGATSVDDVDGDTSENVVIAGTVDSQTAGQYVLQYSAEDSSGNSSEISRTVNVSEEIIAEEEASENSASSTENS